jgi:hypothetical protein
MKNVQTTTTLICDICGKEVKEFACACEGHSEAIVLAIDIWYGGVKSKDICQDCNDEILKLIRDIQKRQETK